MGRSVKEGNFTSSTELGSTTSKENKTVCVTVISKGRSAVDQDLVLYDPFE